MSNRTPKPFSASWWGSSPGPWLSLLVPAILALTVILWTCGAFGEVLLIPQEFPATAATYLLQDQIGKARVLGGTLEMDMDSGTAIIRADILTPGGMVVEIETEVKAKGVNPRRKK